MTAQSKPALSEPKGHSLAEIASMLDAEVIGDGSYTVTAVAHPALAERADTLVLAMDDGSFAALPATNAEAAIVAEGKALDLAKFKGGLAAKRPRLALAQLLALFPRPPHHTEGIHPTASVDPTAEIGENVSIGPLSVVGPGARIGDNSIILTHVSIGAEAVVGADCMLHEGVRIGDRCVLGTRCIVQANACIGPDGFGYVTPDMGSVEAARKTGEVSATNIDIVRINSIGFVVLGDDVEIGACTCVDRGTLGPTRIGNGTKIDNQVQIGHNVSIGENCLIAGQVGIAGSTKIGNRVVFAGGSGIGDHLTVGDDAIILGRSAVARNVPAKGIWGGTPAAPKDDKVQEIFAISRLPRLIRDFEMLKKTVKALQAGTEAAGRADGQE